MRSFFSKSSAKAVMIILTLLMPLCTYAQNSMVSTHNPARNVISESTIREKVEFLTDTICDGRGTGTRGMVETSSWIKREFERIGLLKVNGYYYHRFKTAKGIGGTNVIGFFAGPKRKVTNKYIIVGAHFDHLGNIKGTYYPGADSNASGIAALLSIAEMFNAMKYTGRVWDTNIIFVAFDGNGHDLAGSTALWKKIKKGELIDPVSKRTITPEMITLMVNFDQVGCTLSPLRSGRQDYLIMLGNHSLDESKQEIINSCNTSYSLNMEISHTYYGSENFTNMFYSLSDQRIFVENNIPAVMFTSGITMNNNKTRDKAASLNYPILKKRIYLMYHWIEKML